MVSVFDKQTGIKYAEDILHSFDHPLKIANSIIEAQWLQIRTKGELADTQLNTPRFRSFNYGEYRTVHGGIANIAIALTDEEPIDEKELKEQILDQVNDLSNDYYYDFEKDEIKQSGKLIINKVLKDLYEIGILDKINKKVVRNNFDSVEFISKFYGKKLTHPLGMSSFHRMLVIAVITETPFIQEYFVPMRLEKIHNAKFIKPVHIDKTLNVHGLHGTGYILRTQDSSLCRMYKRLDETKKNIVSILTENQDLKNFVLETPFVPDKVIYEKFGYETQLRLRAETMQLSPYLTEAIIVRRGDQYVLGQHVEILKLRNCRLENNPLISLIKTLYLSVLPSDCPIIARKAQYLTSELTNKGEVKPNDEYERRVLTFLEKRNFIEKKPGSDIYVIKSYPLIKELSIILGNVLD